MKYLLETATTSSNAMQWVLPAILLVLVIGIFVLNYFKSKKTRDNMQQVINSLKVGDKVKTYSGFYGTIVEITETTDGKVAVLQTGSEGNYGYLSIDMNAIYAIDEKKPVVLDQDGNIVDNTQDVAKTETAEVSEVVTPAETQNQDADKTEPEEVQEKPVKKRTTKKKEAKKSE